MVLNFVDLVALKLVTTQSALTSTLSGFLPDVCIRTCSLGELTVFWSVVKRALYSVDEEVRLKDIYAG